MVDFQLPLPGLARDFNNLTQQEKDFIAYFSTIDMDSISPVVDCYAGIGPKGYNVFLILARIIKIKERILSDRQLAEVLKKNDLYRFVTRDIQPAHDTFNFHTSCHEMRKAENQSLPNQSSIVTRIQRSNQLIMV